MTMGNTLFNIEVILAENERRKSALEDGLYQPQTGIGCWGDRVEVSEAKSACSSCMT